MEPDIRDLDVLRLWRDRPGHIDGTLKLAIVVACAVTIAITAVGSSLLWTYYAHPGQVRPFWCRNGVTLLVVLWLVVTGAVPSPLSRLLRIAVTLPIAHAIAMLVTWAVWSSTVMALSRSYMTSTMIDLIPIPLAAIGLVILYVGLARWIARGRRGEGIHAFVMLALWMLLLFGLWLPIASAIWCLDVRGIGVHFDHPIRTTAFVVGPPLALAAGFTTLAFRRPALAREWRPWTTAFVTVLLMTAIATRLGRAENPYVVFSNFIHVLLAVAFVAIAALVSLGVLTWSRARRARTAFASRAALAGTIALDDATDDDPIGCFEVASWLRAPRALLRGFTLITAAGRMVIHGGAQLVAPLPLATTQLRIGESLVALRAGDPVVIAGLDIAGEADPYRALNAPVGAGGLLVASARQDYGFTHVALTMWRPCLAYLMILIVVGIPSLMAAAVFS